MSARIIRELGPGDKGQQVQALQIALIARGAGLKADGVYGRRTSEAVSAYRFSAGLGKGDATREMLQALGVWTETTRGIDVSHHNGRIDWREVAASGVRWCYLKATQGNGFIDPRFHENARGAIDAGLRVGAYHFAEGREVGEHNQFLDVTSHHALTLPPALDIEGPFGLTGRKGEAWVREWLRCSPGAIVYSSARIWREKRLGPQPDALLWAPRYSDHTPDGPQPKTAPWDDWAIWQYTDRGAVPGVDGPCDLNMAVVK
jgi:GH25 family lysozyme M1 (1,4-beta-N-acetylmuramidase)